MFIRYFVTTDTQSVVSALALAYLRSLIRIAPVRLIDPARMIPGLPEGQWARYAALFQTPMDGDFVNVVCTEPERWTWVQKISAPKENKLESEVEEISGRLELYTAGVRNVLITNRTFDSLTAEQKNTAVKYHGVFEATQYLVSHARVRELILGT